MKQDGSSIGRIRMCAILFMGLAHILYLKEYLKGMFFAAVEVIFLISLPTMVNKIIGMITLGDPQPDLPIKQRSNSVFMLIDGIMVLMVIILFLALYIVSVNNATESYKMYCVVGNTVKKNGVSGKVFPILGLAPAVTLVVFFVFVPLVFSACVAFTNYSSPEHLPPNNTVDWVGFDNFVKLFGGDTTWAGALGRVALWTVIWAFSATVVCFFTGLIIAVVLKEAKLKLTPLFRTIFILPYAVPSVVSMLVWANLLNGSFGIVNRTLHTVIPWLSDPTLAKFTCVLINLWGGFPYFMLLVMGTMTSISEDIYEAAKIDGASPLQVVQKITLPLVLYQTMPLLIMGFTANINNFGAIYFLTQGQPYVSDSTLTSAGGTDILITWIYQLTMSAMKYNYASVIAVLIFIFIAPFAIWNFRRTKAYKEGEL